MWTRFEELPEEMMSRSPRSDASRRTSLSRGEERRPGRVEEGGASRGMMVLLEKQAHLQKEVGATDEQLAVARIW